MIHRADATIADSLNTPSPGIYITVLDVNGQEATIYSDDGVTLKANPFTSGLDGTFEYWAAEGVYTEEYRRSLGGQPVQVVGVTLTADDVIRADLASTTHGKGASLIVMEDGTDLQAAITARTKVADLASATAGKGASLVAFESGETVQDLASTATGKGAALVGFLQSGTGAVARTAQAKMREFVSVKDFGAVADITTDDTATIQAAITAQDTYSVGLGKTLFIPAGLYRLTATLATGESMRIFGDGPRQSVLYNEQNPIPTIPAFTESSSLTFCTFENFGARNQKSLLDVTGATDQITYRDLNIMGMADAAFRFRGFLQTSVFDRLEISACAAGIVSETTTCNLVTVNDCAFKDMVGTSLSLAGSQATIVRNARFEGSGDAAKWVVELTGSQQLVFDGGYAEACHKTFLKWTSSPVGVVAFKNFHFTYFSAGVPFLWNVSAGGQLIFENCESTIAMEVPSNSILIGFNKNIYRANPSVASASVVTLPPRQPFVSITGTTTIDALTGGTDYIGYQVTLQFAAATIVRDVSTGGNCKLRGGVDFKARADTTLTLEYDGASWFEVGRNAMLTGSATYDPPSLADGAGVTTTVTVTGAALGDFVTGVSFSLDLQGISLTAWVSAANTVSVRFQNESGGVLDLASGTLRARVQQ